MAESNLNNGKGLKLSELEEKTVPMGAVMKTQGDSKNAVQGEDEASILTNDQTKEVVQMVINRGDYINIRNRADDTALNLSLSEGSKNSTELLVTKSADSYVVGTSELPPLLTAVSYINPSFVESIVRAGGSVNAVDECGNTALINVLSTTHDAARNEEQLLQCVKVLTQHGANVNHSTKDNRYPLLMAVQKKLPSVVRHLLQVGADVNRLDAKGNPILITAVETLSSHNVTYLIDAGASVNSTDKFGRTALIRVLIVGHPSAGRSFVRNKHTRFSDIESYFLPKNDIVKTLVLNGASLDVVDIDKRTPLHLAILYREEELVNLLIEHGANVNKFDEKLYKDILNSGKNLSCNITSKFIDLQILECSICKINYTPLHLTIRIEWEPGFHILLRAGADISLKDIHGYCAIHYAARCTNGNFLRHLLAKYYTSPSDQIAPLNTGRRTQGPSELNCCNVNNATALHIAAVYDKGQNVATLCDAGCDLNIKAQNKMTPLLIALANGFDKIGEILLKAGADINIMTEKGESPFHLACKNNCCRAFNLLLKAAVNIQELNDAGQTVLNHAPRIEISKKLVSLGLDIHHKDNSGFTPLHAAALNGNTDLVRFILNLGQDVNTPTNFGDTPLILASESHNTDVIRLLFDFGANANRQNCDGITALIASCKRSKRVNGFKTGTIYEVLRFSPNLDIQDNSGCTALMYLSQINMNVFLEIKTLLEKKANVNFKSQEGKTALMYSISSCFGECSRILLEYGADPLLGEQSKDLKKKIEKRVDFFLRYSENLRLCLCNGIVFSIGSKCSTPILIQYMLQRRQMSRVRYLLANCCLGARDMQILRSWDSSSAQHDGIWLAEMSHEPIDKDLLRQCRCEPWPLVKLAFIAVSTLLGDTPDRQRRLEKTSLPVKLQEMLMFQTPLARLPVREWSSLHLCFDPIEYERLPKPRPLLYFWPFGKVYY